jgi:NADPH:quinone reductase-like Zn-dependent oxidoreductase
VYPGLSCRKCAFCKSGRENLCSQFAIIGGLSNYNGGYAQKVSVPAANIIPLPPGLKPEIAATLSVSYLTAWNMLETNGAGKKKTILVYGATSGVGMATIQLAKALGARVITTVSSEAKAEFAKKIGADWVIDRTITRDIAAEAARISRGRLDIVIDHVGAATWGTSIACLSNGGRMAVCGTTSGNEAIVPIRTFYTKQITMTGALLGSKKQLSELIRFVIRKKIRPVIDSVYQLKQAAEAQERMEENVHAGKILLRCSSSGSS